jgi:CspA family cold shock protein
VWQCQYVDAFLDVFIILNFSTMQGTVKFFNETKGFGFITPDNSLADDIRENDVVTYDEEQGKKGLNAVNVRRVA